MATKQRDPAHYLHAISLLAYLGADDDGPITVEDDPDEGRRRQRETLLGIRDAADSSEPDLGDARSALALVSAAVDLLDAAEVDARDVGSRDVDRRLRKAGWHLAEVVETLGAAVRIESLEAEVERLRLRVAGAPVPAENVVRIKEAAAVLRGEAAALVDLRDLRVRLQPRVGYRPRVAGRAGHPGPRIAGPRAARVRRHRHRHRHRHRLPVLRPAMLILLIFAGCAGHYTPPPMPVCRESATLPDAATTYECPVGAQVAVHEAAGGPVFLCLCPAMDEIDEAVVRLEVGGP